MLGKSKTQKQLDATVIAINSMLDQIYKNKSTDEYKMKGDISKSPSYKQIQEMVADLSTLKKYPPADAADINKLFNTLHRPIFKTLVKEYMTEHNDRNTVFTSMFTIGYRLLVGELARIYASTEATDKGIVYKPNKFSKKDDTSKLIKLFNDDLERKLNDLVRDMKEHPEDAPVSEAYLMTIMDVWQEQAKEEEKQELSRRSKRVLKGTLLGFLVGIGSVAACFVGFGEYAGLYVIFVGIPTGTVTGVLGGLRGSKTRGNNEKDVVAYIDKIMVLLTREYSRKVLHDLKQQAKYLVTPLSRLAEDHKNYTKEKTDQFVKLHRLTVKFVDAISARTPHIDKDLMGEFSKTMLDVREILTDVKTEDLKTKLESSLVQEAVEAGEEMSANNGAPAPVNEADEQGVTDGSPETVEEADEVDENSSDADMNSTDPEEGVTSEYAVFVEDGEGRIERATQALERFAGRVSGYSKILGAIVGSAAIIGSLFSGIKGILKGFNPIADINYYFMSSYDKKIAKLASVSSMYDATKRAYDEYMKIPQAQRQKRVESKYIKNMEKYNIVMNNLAAEIDHFDSRAKKESQEVVADVEKKIPTNTSTTKPQGGGSGDTVNPDDDLQF